MTLQSESGRDLLARAVDPTDDAVPAVVPEFRELYEEWFDPVCRWLAALGGPQSDVEDLAQEVFIVVRRKLAAFDGRNLGGWLYRISARTVSDHRRRAWFKHLFRARRDDEAFAQLANEDAGPADLLEKKEARRVLYALLDKLSEKRRRVLILAELEGLSSEEIAALENIPAATVRTRLFHARQELVELCRRHRTEGPA